MKLQSTRKNLASRPVLYNFKISESKRELSALVSSNTGLEIIDEIFSQLTELLKLRSPKKSFSAEELSEQIDTHLDGVPLSEYGIWVYYPWINKLVHVLGEDEFVEVRTNRNQYKITPKEESTLAEKRIGIIGLSVGKAIALTIALERICGELVIADFDQLELSNLNRIQTGVQNLGLKKTIVVAREIAEMDPYLKVTCFHDGLTEENSDAFFIENGKLDICIEVCDGLHPKIFARQKAKELGIPVVMNSSDRGTTDIERFDLDPNLPILHGLIDHLDLSLLKQAKTNEEKVPYLLPMIGVETASARLKASMLEINESITTWPQLASGVVLGGAICTDVCRRILLDQFTKSGRYFVDIEDHINNDIEDHISASASRLQEDQIQRIPKTSLKDYQELLDQIDQELLLDSKSIELTDAEVRELVNYAIMAPSGGNVQPWKWLYRNKSLMLFDDLNRSKSILNYKKMASAIGLGAATENLILKAHQMGYEVEVNKFPLGIDQDLMAIFTFHKEKTKASESHQHDHFIDFVPERQTNRNLGTRTDLEPELVAYFQDTVRSVKGAGLKVFTDTGKLEEIKDIIAEVDRLFLTNKTGLSQFVSEVRWTQNEVEETRDGVDINTLDITPTEEAGFIVSKDWQVTKHLKQWDLGQAFGKLSGNAIGSSSAIGLVTMPKHSRDHIFDGGRAIQRLWLAATEKEIGLQPMYINTFLFTKAGNEDFEYFEEIKERLLVLRGKYLEATGLADDEKDVFLVRLSKAKNPKVRSLRRQTNDVFLHE